MTTRQYKQWFLGGLILLVSLGTTSLVTADVDDYNPWNQHQKFDGGITLGPEKKVSTTLAAATTLAYTTPYRLVYCNPAASFSVGLPDPDDFVDQSITFVHGGTAGQACILDAGTYSILGSVTNSDMDAVGDSYTLLSTGSAWVVEGGKIQ